MASSAAVCRCVYRYRFGYVFVWWMLQSYDSRINQISRYSGNCGVFRKCWFEFSLFINLSCIFFVFHHSFECIGNYLVNLQSNSLSLNICREKPHDILRILTLKPNLSCNSFSKWRVSYFARSNKVASL